MVTFEERVAAYRYAFLIFSLSVSVVLCGGLLLELRACNLSVQIVTALFVERLATWMTS
jgi:hypothetical protein